MDTRSTDPRDYQKVARPVAAMPKAFAAGSIVPPHRHERAQLAFAVSGIMSISTEEGVWVVPPNRALWVPPETEHSVRATTRLLMRTLYIEKDAAPGLPDRVSVIDVSPLLRELILAAAEAPVLYEEGGREGRIMALILDEIRRLKALPVELPMPRDPRLVELCGAVRRAPERPWRLEAEARRLGMSGRSLARLCGRELGMSFAAWCRRARLLAALERLAGGETVTAVALDCGYESPSAFAAMFRRQFGVTPRRYFL